MSKSEPSVARGALITVMMRWTDRLIGFVSTLILARLLVPDDFGIIAMASTFIELVNVFLDLGVHISLIQNKDPSQDHYDTAWTLRLIQTSLATLIIFLTAPLAALYFKDPRVAPVLRVLSFSFIFGGLENIGVVTFQKEMKFGLDFRFVFLKRICGFTATMVAAFVLRSYWALVIGTISGRVSGVALSYFSHSMRPSFSFVKFREIFSVSQWVMVRSVSGFLENSLHKLVVGRRESSAIMGAYALADEISAMPSTELLAPLNRVLFPAFVRVKGDLDELKRIFLLSQGLQILLCLPACVGLGLLANEVVRIMLGDKWLIAISFIQILAFVHMFSAVTSSSEYVLMTLGRIRILAIFSWIQVSLFALGAFALIPNGGAITIAWMRLIVAVGGVVFIPWFIIRALPGLRVWDMFKNLIRPLIAVSAMALCLRGLGPLDIMPIVFIALIKIVAGAISYTVVVLMLWQLAGRPYGAETYLLEKFGLKL